MVEGESENAPVESPRPAVEGAAAPFDAAEGPSEEMEVGVAAPAPASGDGSAAPFGGSFPPSPARKKEVCPRETLPAEEGAPVLPAPGPAVEATALSEEPRSAAPPEPPASEPVPSEAARSEAPAIEPLPEAAAPSAPNEPAALAEAVPEQPPAVEVTPAEPRRRRAARRGADRPAPPATTICCR